MSLHDDIMAALQTIPDPEMPISIVDLGIVENVSIDRSSDGTRDAVGADADAVVSIDVLPTFVGCPALPIIEEDIRAKVSALPGVSTVHVSFVFDPPWSVTRITEQGRASLKEHGVTVPESGSKLAVHDQPKITTQVRTSAVPCPFCDSTSTYLDSPFGPTRCRMIYYCEACKNSFEHMKRV